jgi:cytochrome c biogenesis protein CcmG, thiol:disulfide interchange protein DsbE
MSKKIRPKLLLASLLTAIAFLTGCERSQRPVVVGEPAPDFTLPSLAEDSIALSDYRRQVVVLNFWATWCPPCVEETPSLEKFSAEMRKLHVAVIGVSVDQDEATLKKFAADYHLSFPIGRDPNQVLASRYGTSKFPETYILDRHGRVAEKIIGAIDWQDPRIVSFVQTLSGNPEPVAP